MLNLSKLHLLALFLLLLSLPGCGRSTATERAKTLVTEANELMRRATEIGDQWSREFRQVFTPENRAQFPSNRDSLISRSEKIIALLDESARLANEAAAKFEDASRLMGKDQDKKGLELIAAAMRKGVEIDQLFKALAQIPSDRTINDAKSFNQKSDQITSLYQQKNKERDEQLAEGKRLLRW
jgi:hypothetical protein